MGEGKNIINIYLNFKNVSNNKKYNKKENQVNLASKKVNVRHINNKKNPNHTITSSKSKKRFGQHTNKKTNELGTISWKTL